MAEIVIGVLLPVLVLSLVGFFIIGLKMKSREKKLKKAAEKVKNSFPVDLQLKLRTIKLLGNNGQGQVVKAINFKDAIPTSIAYGVLLEYKDGETEIKVHGESIIWGHLSILKVFILHKDIRYLWDEVF